MKTVVQLYQQLSDTTLGVDELAITRCRLAKELEESGDYEAARAALGSLWQRVGERPRLDGLSERAAGELLLRSGALTGWLGAARQIIGAQDLAKDLLSESISRFESIDLSCKVHESQVEIAWIYCHEGAFDESRAILEHVISLLADAEADLKGVALVRCALVEIKLGRYESALKVFLNAGVIVKASSNHSLRGRYYNGLALVYRKLAPGNKNSVDYLDQALINYTAAAFHFEEAGHVPYIAVVENNLGFLLFKAGRFTEAEAHLNTARKLFADIRDEKRVAETDDTRARLLLAEGRPAQAERVMRGAVYTLEKGGRQALLSEALTTQAVALARLSEHSKAQESFHRAIEISEFLGNRNGVGQAALAVMEELEDRLTQEDYRQFYDKAKDNLTDSQHDETRERLRQCKLKVFAVVEKSGLRSFSSSSCSPLPLGYIAPGTIEMKRLSAPQFIHYFDHESGEASVAPMSAFYRPDATVPFAYLDANSVYGVNGEFIAYVNFADRQTLCRARTHEVIAIRVGEDFLTPDGEIWASVK
ncbi:MAG: tetratricopeptide repeat protein [Pyrinomonadaceae bacterium]